MKTSELGLDLIRGHEGLRLKAYQCPAGVWTIGFGHTGAVRPGQEITREEADTLLRKDVEDAEKSVSWYVTVPLTQDQFDALVSFVFNLGIGKLKGSTLLRLLNGGDYKGAADEFPRWVFAGKVRLNGLIARRADEKSLFLRGTA